MHRFAQCFAQISIDGAIVKVYLAHQIEPGSLRTLRLSLEGAASLNSGCAENLNCEARSLDGSIEKARHASRRVASPDGIGKVSSSVGSVWKARQASRQAGWPDGIGKVRNFYGSV
jgi:hypothetical protein